ncbi:DUF5666 domain-containing protein [Undibacterium sp. TJN19]|uniref:DUF5666 domain-containing protein n=1 Tax=Undibacterium sp. TJN19 TaxID=3413055 RepID=UPI003BF24C7F
MKRQSLIIGGLATICVASAFASTTQADIDLLKQNTGNVSSSYVQSVDTSRKTITVDQTTYAITPTTVIQSGNKTVPASNIQKGTRVKIDAEKKPGQILTAKSIWVMQQPSGK